MIIITECWQSIWAPFYTMHAWQKKQFCWLRMERKNISTISFDKQTRNAKIINTFHSHAVCVVYVCLCTHQATQNNKKKAEYWMWVAEISYLIKWPKSIACSLKWLLGNLQNEKIQSYDLVLLSSLVIAYKHRSQSCNIRKKNTNDVMSSLEDR